MGKAVPILLALALLLSGCSSIQNGEYEASHPHESAQTESVADAELTLEAQDYAELLDAVSGFIAQGVERGAIHAAGYEGNLETDLAKACLTASTETALGAYCVYFINYSVSTLVSLVEANVSVIYLHDPAEAARIPLCEDETELETLMVSALKSRADSVTLKTEGEDVDEAAILKAVESAYYSNPADILYIPTCDVTAYPETGAERILEMTFTYPYATSTVEQRRRSLEEKAKKIVDELPDGTQDEKLLAMAVYFAENVTYDATVNASDAQARRYSAMTAYGALNQGLAVGEGYAMGLKVLCDMAGVECSVIRGRFNNIDHAWNLVRMENGELYHLDLVAFNPEGAAFKNDEQQRYAGYWWDATQYPWCSGPSLYGEEFDPPSGDNPGPSVPPVGWLNDDSRQENGGEPQEDPQETGEPAENENAPENENSTENEKTP